MSKVKNQHFVPQSYLQRFTATADQAKIWIFDKVTRRSFDSNVRNVASETHFYDFHDDNIQALKTRLDQVPESQLSANAKRKLLNPHFVEHELARMEAEYAATVDELILHVEATGSFTQGLKERMAYFLTQQL